MQTLNGKWNNTVPTFAISQDWYGNLGISSWWTPIRQFGTGSVKKTPEAIALRAQKRLNLIQVKALPMGLWEPRTDQSSLVASFLQLPPRLQALFETVATGT